MASIPSLTFVLSNIFKGTTNLEGEMVNAYSPFQNLEDQDGVLTDFTTEELNFDLQHPVDIDILESYDGAVNLIFNDGKNVPRLVNSRFSVLDEKTFKIPDHVGYKDTNLYDSKTFNIDTALKPIALNIPKIKFDGLYENHGSLSCGAYTFYFKLADADGNESEVVAESGVVQVHMGNINSPSEMRMGLLKENSKKAVKFLLSNIDSGFDYVHVLFVRSSSSETQAVVDEYSKIMYNYPVIDGNCEITITGKEVILGMSADELKVDYADINSVKTQAICNNLLLLGNVDKPEHDVQALRQIAWRIIPRFYTKDNVGSLTKDYTTLGLFDKEEDKLCYYNSKNVYYRVGYWPDEIYRFGIIYIFEDNSLSKAYDIQGIDFTNLVNNEGEFYTDHLKINGLSLTSYELLFYNTAYGWSWEAETDDYYFRHPELTINNNPVSDNILRMNSRGVIKFPKINVFKNTENGSMVPSPLYINFDLSNIGKTVYGLEKPGEDYISVFKKHKIKGFFFVRQKRIPTILGLGVVVGLTSKYHGSIPVLKNNNGSYCIESFLAGNRMLYHEGTEYEINTDNKLDYKKKLPITPLAMLCPEAELNEATYNELFISNEWMLDKVADYSFYKEDSSTITIKNIKPTYTSTLYIGKLTVVPEETRMITNGTDYFSTLAGDAYDPIKTIDTDKLWKWTAPLDLTTSTTLVRGNFGPYIGLGNPKSSTHCPYQYGEVYNIKDKKFLDNYELAMDNEFQRRFNTFTDYHAISDRVEITDKLDCYRGDCYASMFTHRMYRNFFDPDTPTNVQIVDPACWTQNYGVKCTASILTSAHSNLTSGTEGWYIEDALELRKHDLLVQAVIYFLTCNIFGGIAALVKANDASLTPDDLGLTDDWIYYDGQDWKISGMATLSGKDTVVNKLISCRAPNNAPTQKGWYKVDYWEYNDNMSNDLAVPVLLKDDEKYIMWDETLVGQAYIEQMYPNGIANEIVQAFETYIGPVGFSVAKPITSLIKLVKYGSSENRGPSRKKLNPKELENSSGGGLKAIFKADDEWEMHGTSSINRSDINAVCTGQWITFPILTTHNMALRDIDFSLITEETVHRRKRGFYPLYPKDKAIKLRDSNVLNGASGISIPQKSYIREPNLPFKKLEFFTRVFNSCRDSAGSITNEFKVMFQGAFKDYTKEFGSLTKLVPAGNNVFAIFEHGIGMIPLAQSMALAPDATKFLPPMTVLTTTYGSMWKDSIVSSDYCTYGVDSVAKVIWALKHSGEFNIISNMKIESFLIDNLDMSEFVTKPYIGHVNIKGHYNNFKHDVMFTYYNDIPKDADNNILTLEEFDKLDHWEKGKQWSVCWNEPMSQFITFYDWVPLESENIDNIYFSFDKEEANRIAAGEEDTSKILLSGVLKAYNNKVLTDAPREYLTEITLKKYNIDKAFTEQTSVFNVKDTNFDVCVTEFDINIPLKADLTYAFGVYVNTAKNHKLELVASNKSQSGIAAPVFFSSSIPYKKFDMIDTDGNWEYKTILFVSNIDLPNGLAFTVYPEIKNGKFTYMNYSFAEPSLTIIDKDKNAFQKDLVYRTKDSSNTDGVIKYIDAGINRDLINDKEWWVFRNKENSMRLWKHGVAGIYDNQGKLLPTNWYGKQHEFNFEFVVNEAASIHKVFNNLKMVSNKAEPYRFEYEVVGEVYEWYEYKPIIVWINLKVDEDVFSSLQEGYKFVLSNTYGEILALYTDFPTLFNKQDTFLIEKLPYLRVVLSRPEGTKDSLHWVNKDPNYNYYSDNTTEDGAVILVYDYRLNEYRLHTEHLANDVKKYGRVRGNMLYLEDLWDIEIRPISFKYAYISNDELELSVNKETRHRDKYIKIKVRYTGEDLAIIQSVFTMYDYSYA